MAENLNYDSLFELIERLTTPITKQIEKIMPSVNESIENIINNNITSSRAIERVLDQLLDYTTLGFGGQEFKRLNQYYSSINKENAAFYEKEFNQLENYE
ncbi:MAG: hypothetical protein AABX24_03120 [Nanoarchaeota archaeon]